MSDTPDRRHRDEIVADLVAERKRTYDLERENAVLRADNRKLALHTAEQAKELGKLRDQLEEAQDKALRFDLDSVGIERREAEGAELVTLRAELSAAQARIAELEAGNAVLRAERDGYSARLDAAIKLIADILSALPPNAVKAPDGTIYEFDPPPEYAMQMLRAFKAGIDAAIREGR